MMPVRVLLVDDHALVREGVAALLETFEGMEVVGQADSAEQAIALLATLETDLVLMDISMRGMSGIDATARIKHDHPALKVVMLSMHTQPDFVRRALQAGATGYLLKGASPVELELALRSVARSETYLSPGVTQPVVADFIRQAALPQGPLASLTPRQREILQGIATGQTTKQIAFGLQISTKTVETHRTQLMDRLDIHDIAGLVRFAVRQGLVSDEC